MRELGGRVLGALSATQLRGFCIANLEGPRRSVPEWSRSPREDMLLFGGIQACLVHHTGNLMSTVLVVVSQHRQATCSCINWHITIV